MTRRLFRFRPVLSGLTALAVLAVSMNFPQPAFAALPSTASLPQSGSIVSRWYLNEASGNRADAVGSNTLSDNNSVLSAAGQFSETAADFENANDEYLSVADNVSLSITGNQTHAMWVMVESQPSGGVEYYIESKWTLTQRTFIFAYGDYAGVKKIRFYLSSSLTSDVPNDVTQTLSNATWYHLTWVYTAAAGTAEIYVNGVSLATLGGFDTDFTDGSAAYILGTADPALFSAEHFDGLMQDAMVWNAALSDAEVTSLYNSYFASAATPRFKPRWW